HRISRHVSTHYHPMSVIPDLVARSHAIHTYRTTPPAPPPSPVADDNTAGQTMILAVGSESPAMATEMIIRSDSSTAAAMKRKSCEETEEDVRREERKRRNRESAAKCRKKLKERMDSYVGEHQISVKYDGEEVCPPIVVQAEPTGDVNKIQIKGKFKDKLAANEETTITVATDKAGGNGDVTCRVTRTQSSSETSESSTERYETLPDGGTRIIKTTKRETKTATSREVQDNIDCKVVANGDGTYSVKYKVQEPGDYTIEVKYGGQVVPNGVFNFTVS
ncbi:unnamed protein product, partial [Medioppia subpectinata]